MDNKTIPTKLLSDSKGSIVDNSSFLSAKVKAFYFSAHWCSPCCVFTPSLAKLYKKVNEKEKELEIIFVSSDKSKFEFESYFEEMPWLAVPFDDRETIKKLANKYSVKGIPSLLVIDNEGNILNEDGYVELAQADDPVEVINDWKSYY